MELMQACHLYVSPCARLILTLLVGNNSEANRGVGQCLNVPNRRSRYVKRYSNEHSKSQVSLRTDEWLESLLSVQAMS